MLYNLYNIVINATCCTDSIDTAELFFFSISSSSSSSLLVLLDALSISALRVISMASPTPLHIGDSSLSSEVVVQAASSAVVVVVEGHCRFCRSLELQIETLDMGL